MELAIRWKYPLDDEGGNRIFNQIIKVNLQRRKFEMPSVCMGVCIASLFSACKVDSPIDGYMNSPAFREWRNIVGVEYLNLNEGEIKLKCLLFDSIAYPAFCIFKNVDAMLKELSDDRNTREIFSSSAREILGDDFVRDAFFSERFFAEIQGRIDRYIEPYNQLLAMSRNEFSYEFYTKLCDCLRKYNKSELIPQYLAKQGEKGRCFATFIDDATDTKYISFSGFVDAVDPTIIAWVDKSRSESADFVEVASEICNSMGAIFVPINMKTRRYHSKNQSPFAVMQGLPLEEVIRCNLKGVKKYYSCCERKIFGHFDDDTPNGRLFVKIRICGECSLGLDYQRRNGNSIVLFDGLEC